MREYKHQARLIRDARTKHGITQKELADAMGLASSQYISNIERGLSPLPAKYRYVVSDVLGLTPQALADAKLKDIEPHL